MKSITKLAEEATTPTKKDSAALNSSDEEALVASLPSWTLTTQTKGRALRSTFKFKKYRTALRFLNQIAELAEAENHHPKMTIEWGLVSVEWFSNEIHGFHRNDFILAARTQLAYQESV